jgi:homoaconitate hydratase
MQSTTNTGQSIVEKIATRHASGLADGQKVHSGDYITIRPKHIMTHDNTGAIMAKFRAIGAASFADPRQPVFAIDHDIQNKSEENLAKYARIEAFAREHDVDFYPAGTGISHQVMIEQGYVTPGCMAVASDSHSNIYGAMAALGTPVVRTDAASIWATGQTWWQVPPLARVRLEGSLRPGVVGKDVIIALCGEFNNDEVLNHAVEFAGDGIAGLSMDHRMSIANMTTEWGALTGVFPFDDVLRDYLYARADYLATTGRDGVYTRDDVDRWYAQRDEADADTAYAVDITLDLSTVIPHVSGPDHVKKKTSLPEITGRRVAVQKAYLLSCVNARISDIAEAAAFTEGKTVADGVEFYVAAASAEIQKEAEAKGYWKALSDAGAVMLPPGCGPCIGLGQGTIGDGEVGISATNRNFKGRMGSRDAEVYLASPAVVAASAISGYISAPESWEETPLKARLERNEPAARAAGAVEILDGFPEKVTGRALFMNKDNINTDGIYAGKWTYKDDMTPEQMAEVVFENYDENFSGVYQEGDVVVSCRNFGSGSSREQAATALHFRGIPCVIAYSFSQTYKRNAFNNGFPVFECPDLVEHLTRNWSGDGSPTVVGPDLEIDFRSSVVRCDGKEFAFPPLGRVPQELIVAGGAENLVKKRM